MAKVLLVQAKYGTNQMPWIPLAFLALGSLLKSKNHDVKVFDRNINTSEHAFLDTLKKFDPDIVGMTSMTGYMLIDILQVSKIVKENSKATFIVGGVHATADPMSLMRVKTIDYIVRGEGEDVLLDICSMIDKNKHDFKRLKNINLNPLREPIDLDRAPTPDYDLIDLRKYPQLIFTTSRGCPGNCTFCYNEYYWNKLMKKKCVRYYNTKNTISMFTKVIDDYNLREFMIVDDMFATMAKRTFDICRALEKHDVIFHAYQRVDFTQDKIMSALKKAGCWALQFGLESGSQKTLDFIQKGTTVQQNIDAIYRSRKYGIFVDAAFMIGLPGEKIEDVNLTRQFIKKYNPDAYNVNIFMPYPGSTLFEYCLKKGMINRPETIEEWKKFFSKKTGDINVSEVPTEYLLKLIDEFNKKDFSTYLKKTMFLLKSGHYRFVFLKSKNILARKLGISKEYW